MRIMEYNLALFFRFLKNRGAYNTFIKQCFLLRNISLKYYYPTSIFYDAIICKTNIYMPPTKYLTCAFIWSKSKEGADFWRELHTEWCRSFCGDNDCIDIMGFNRDYKKYIFRKLIKKF